MINSVVNRINDTIKLGCMNDVKVVAPFHEKQKYEIVEFLISQNSAIEFSSSCYRIIGWTEEDQPIHCGSCESCQRRKRAFELSKNTDFTKYYS